MSVDSLIPLLLTLAWLAPLVGMVVSWIAGRLVVDRRSRLPAWIAIGAMAVSLILALLAGFVWWVNQPIPADDHWYARLAPLSGIYYTLGDFGGLNLSIGYYIDTLTLLMFGVVTLISMAVHVYSVAYMREGLPDDDLEDAIEAETDAVAFEAPDDAQPSTSNPQLPRFFTLLQFFTFTMLGLVLAGNLLQVFVFWELVGAASYFLIGFHFERPHAAVASTKAFLMNRVGDAGFLIGMMILWTAFGTLAFQPPAPSPSYAGVDVLQPFPPPGLLTFTENLSNADSWASYSADDSNLDEIDPETLRLLGIVNVPRWWIVAAGLCLFAGCVGKSAQLPLSTWLPDAMAGPTPVSALVHSATMVAAGVYLVGRLYSLFLPEVLIVIAYVGAATLVYGATCAVVQTDLKRILAYSTISQLGYMMLALGVGGRDAGLYHLVTHAFFKSLLFLAAGSVIVACHHVQDLSQMGGLRKKMPWTAYTSLVGVIAIAGLAVPFVQPFGEAIAFSGYHSKDSILAAALHFTRQNPGHSLLFLLPLLTAGLTAFYMFRFWLLAFVGKPRDTHLHEQAKESSPWMTGPLIALAVFAAFVAIGGERGPLFEMLHGMGPINIGDLWYETTSSETVEVHHTASLWGLILAVTGTIAACLYYGLRDAKIRPVEFISLRGRIADGWMLDRLYQWLVVRPIYGIAHVAAWCDRVLLDGFLHGFSRFVLAVARVDRLIDDYVVDGFVNRLAAATYSAGLGLRTVQTGRLRQYVVALAVASIVLFALAIIVVPRII